MWGTLRVVTTRELVVLNGSFTSHSKSARRLRHFTLSCEPREIHSLQCWRARNKSPQAYPAHTGDWTQGLHVTGAHATTCAIARFPHAFTKVSKWALMQGMNTQCRAHNSKSSSIFRIPIPSRWEKRYCNRGRWCSETYLPTVSQSLYMCTLFPAM